MTFKAVFLFVAPGVDSLSNNHEFVSEGFKLKIQGTSSYDEAEKFAKEFAEGGYTAIELCAGFGNEGVARIAKAVKGKAQVGVVRFDHHPALGFKSGDNFFIK